MRWSFVVPAGFAAALVGLFVWRSLGSAPTPTRTARPVASGTFPTLKLPTQRQIITSPRWSLLWKEEWSLAYAPTWEQHLWLMNGRPPVYLSGGGNYYFFTNPQPSSPAAPVPVQCVPGGCTPTPLGQFTGTAEIVLPDLTRRPVYLPWPLNQFYGEPLTAGRD